MPRMWGGRSVFNVEKKERDSMGPLLIKREKGEPGRGGVRLGRAIKAL